MTPHHRCGDDSGMTSPILSENSLLCRPCLLDGQARKAWTVTQGDATCIRHAVEPTDLDDVDQHDLFVVIYEQLRQAAQLHIY